MLTVLTIVRPTTVLWQDGHHSQDGHYPITTFSTVHEFGSQKFLPDWNLIELVEFVEFHDLVEFVQNNDLVELVGLVEIVEMVELEDDFNSLSK